MAEGFARHYHPSHTFYSAGMKPSGKVNPHAITVMQEKGIDLTSHKSQHLVQAFTSKKVPLDYVVTVCGNADEDCPRFNKENPYQNTRIVHVGFDDPPELANSKESQEEKLQCYRRVRDEIEVFIKDMMDSLPKLKYR